MATTRKGTTTSPRFRLRNTELAGALEPDNLSSRTVRRPRPGVYARMTLHQVATELGVGDRTAARWLRRYEWMGLAPHTHAGVTTYDTAAFERLKAIKSIPNRADHDWLAHYLGEPHV